MQATACRLTHLITLILHDLPQSVLDQPGRGTERSPGGRGRSRGGWGDSANPAFLIVPVITWVIERYGRTCSGLKQKKNNISRQVSCQEGQLPRKSAAKKPKNSKDKELH